MNTIINICKKISLVTFLPFFMLFIIGCSDSEENTEVPDSKNETETPDKEDDSEEGVFYYVRQEAKGTNDGSDWNNAFIDIPESMVRDAVYYIADGEYADYVFDAPEDGEKVITIKKATIDDHGTNVGWEQEFGNEHAQFRSLEINTGFWIIDGSRRTSKKSGHGFRIVVPGDKDVAEHGIRVFGTLSSTRINNISIKYVEFSSDIVEFPDLDGWVVKNGYDQTRGGDNIYIGYSYFHRLIGMHRTRAVNNFVAEHNYYEDNKNIGTTHGDAIQLWGSDASSNSVPSRNCVIRFNEFCDIEGTAFINVAWGISKLRVYGNIFYYSLDNKKTGAWTTYIFKGSVGPVYVYNNTMVNGNYGEENKAQMAFYINPESSVPEGSERYIYNNLWFSCRSVGSVLFENRGYHFIGQSQLHPSYKVESTSIQSDNDPFVNWSEYDFHLAESLGTGKILTSESWWDLQYDSEKDMHGNTRGADGIWDIGAFEF